MTKVRRFMNTYGAHTRPQRGYEQWRQVHPFEGPWVGASKGEISTFAEAVRLVPRKSDHVKATDWGMYAYECRVSAYDYYAGIFQFRGEGIPSTAGLNQEGLPFGISISRSPTHVYIYLPDSMVSACHNAARAKAGEGFNFALAAMEGEKTIDMLVNILVRVSRAYRAARRGRWQEAWRHLGGTSRGSRPTRDAADNWLQFQYGVMPLVYDAYALQEHYKRGFSRKGATHKVRVNRTNTASAVETLRGYPSNFDRYSGSGTKYGITVAYEYRISDAEANNLTRLGATNPFLLAWEAVPLSFVIDWFMPIGAFLNALIAPFGTTFVSGYETRYIETDATCIHCRMGFDQYQSGSLTTVRVKRFASQRTTLTSYPSAKVSLGLGIDSISKGITALALLRQRA